MPTIGSLGTLINNIKHLTNHFIQSKIKKEDSQAKLETKIAKERLDIYEQTQQLASSDYEKKLFFFILPQALDVTSRCSPPSITRAFYFAKTILNISNRRLEEHSQKVHLDLKRQDQKVQIEISEKHDSTKSMQQTEKHAQELNSLLRSLSSIINRPQ